MRIAKQAGTRWLNLGVAVTLLVAAAPAQAVDYTHDFGIERCKFVASGRDNPYFSLHPGDQSTLEGVDDGEAVKVEITVTSATKNIRFQTIHGVTMTVPARVVVEREWVDGELVEVSRNWFSRCRQTNDVFYFGEEVDLYEDGEIVGHDGAWQAGVAGAQPGIIVPARFLMGSRYFQDQAPGAMDRAEHVSEGFSVQAAGRSFGSCGGVVETSPLEPGHESMKVYCYGIGMVLDNDVSLTSFRRN